MHVIIIIVSQPIPVAGQSTTWVCGRSLFWIAGSNPAGGIDDCLCEGYVLSRRGPCVELITRLEESYLVCECVWVWSWNLDSDEALAQYGL